MPFQADIATTENGKPTISGKGQRQTPTTSNGPSENGGYLVLIVVAAAQMIGLLVIAYCCTELPIANIFF